MAEQTIDLKVSSVDLIQYVDQLEEMHPITFRLVFGLTHETAAEELGLEPQTMRSYVKKNPSRRVRKLAAAIAKRWIRAGRPIMNAHYLLTAISSEHNSQGIAKYDRSR